MSEGVAPLFAAGLAELGVSPEHSRRLVPLLARYSELVHAWSQQLNLTGHPDLDSIATHLVLDAVALERELPAARRLVDVGSGAGIPGIPIAILRPETTVVLIEARERRHHFLRTAIRVLGLANIRVLHGRAETLDVERCDCAIAQAAGPFSEVVPWLVRWTAPGGAVAVPITPTQPLPPLPRSIARARVVSYRVPVSGRERAVWIGERAPD